MCPCGCPRSEKTKKEFPKKENAKKNKKKYAKRISRKRKSLEAAPSSLRLSADKVVPTARHNGSRHQDHRSQRHHFRPAYRGRTRIAAPGDFLDAGQKPIPLTNKPDYLANMVASAIRTGRLEAWARGSWTVSSGGMFGGDLGRTTNRTVQNNLSAPH
jgi:hypothetical protein